jgi:hypothetical protein
MPDDDGTPLVSGSIMLDQLEVMAQLAGRPAFDRALESLPAEEQELWRGLMRIQWVNTHAANRFIAAVAREAGRDAEAFLLDVARTGVEQTLKGVWKIILRFTTDNALVSRTPMLYSKTYDAGRMTAKIEKPGEAHILLEGWPGVPRMDVLGLQSGIEAVLRCAGRANVQVTWRRTPDGVSFTGTWDR